MARTSIQWTSEGRIAVSSLSRQGKEHFRQALHALADNPRASYWSGRTLRHNGETVAEHEYPGTVVVVNFYLRWEGGVQTLYISGARPMDYMTTDDYEARKTQ